MVALFSSLSLWWRKIRAHQCFGVCIYLIPLRFILGLYPRHYSWSERWDAFRWLTGKYCWVCILCIRCIKKGSFSHIYVLRDFFLSFALPPKGFNTLYKLRSNLWALLFIHSLWAPRLWFSLRADDEAGDTSLFSEECRLYCSLLYWEGTQAHFSSGSVIHRVLCGLVFRIFLLKKKNCYLNTFESLFKW